MLHVMLWLLCLILNCQISFGQDVEMPMANYSGTTRQNNTNGPVVEKNGTKPIAIQITVNLEGGKFNGTLNLHLPKIFNVNLGSGNMNNSNVYHDHDHDHDHDHTHDHDHDHTHDHDHDHDHNYQFPNGTNIPRDLLANGTLFNNGYVESSVETENDGETGTD